MNQETKNSRMSILSFRYALEGIYQAIKEEPNLKFHLTMAIIAIVLGLFFQISDLDWMLLILTIGLVITAELTNTAVETIVDSFTQKEHPAAKYAKDIAAGAVLILAITSIIIGAIIFLPYIIGIFIK